MELENCGEVENSQDNDPEEDLGFTNNRRLLRKQSDKTKRLCAKEERNATIKRVSLILQKSEQEHTTEETNLLNEYSDIVKEVKSRWKKRDEAKRRLEEYEEPYEEMHSKCITLAQAIAQSQHLVVYTGAGISTAARIPDYRGTNGIWTRLQQGKDIGNHDLSLAEPTYTHMALSELYKRNKLKYVVSQNCDGLHLRSGLPRTAVSEVHGNMYIEVCKNCKPAREYWRMFDVTENTARYSHKTMRKCYHCNGCLIDTIVHFGERGSLQWPLNWSGASKNAKKATTILCLGSSLKVLKKYPWLWQMHKPVKRRPNLYIVNLQWTPKDDCANVKINGKCDVVMKTVMDLLGIDVPEYDRNRDPIFVHGTALSENELHTTTQPFLKDIAKNEIKKEETDEIEHVESCSIKQCTKMDEGVNETVIKNNHDTELKLESDEPSVAKTLINGTKETQESSFCRQFEHGTNDCGFVECNEIKTEKHIEETKINDPVFKENSATTSNRNGLKDRDEETKRNGFNTTTVKPVDNEIICKTNDQIHNFNCANMLNEKVKIKNGFKNDELLEYDIKTKTIEVSENDDTVINNVQDKVMEHTENIRADNNVNADTNHVKLNERYETPNQCHGKIEEIIRGEEYLDNFKRQCTNFPNHKSESINIACVNTGNNAGTKLIDFTVLGKPNIKYDSEIEIEKFGNDLLKNIHSQRPIPAHPDNQLRRSDCSLKIMNVDFVKSKTRIYAEDKRNLKIRKRTMSDSVQCGSENEQNVETNVLNSKNCDITAFESNIYSIRGDESTGLNLSLPKKSVFSIDNILNRNQERMNCQTLLNTYYHISSALYRDFHYPFQTSLLYSGLHSIISPLPLINAEHNYSVVKGECKEVDGELTNVEAEKKTAIAGGNCLNVAGEKYNYAASVKKCDDGSDKYFEIRNAAGEYSLVKSEVCPIPEPNCLYCHENYNSYSCLFYKKCEPVFLKQPFRYSKVEKVEKPLYCVCCDYTTEEEDEDEDMAAAEEEKDPSSPSPDKICKVQDEGEPKVKIQPGWFGKGYRKNRKYKKKMSAY